MTGKIPFESIFNFSRVKFRFHSDENLFSPGCGVLPVLGGKYIIEKKIREEMIMTYFTYKMAFLQKKTQHAVYY